MFVDGRSVENGSVFERDVCIVGAGAAGITLAMALDRAGIDVDLVESGGLVSFPKTQRLTLAKIRDMDHFANRLRYFGGTTNHWGGWCQPLTEFEFQAHPWVPDSGWPMPRAELDPYYEAARDVLGLPSPAYRFETAEEGAYPEPPLLADQTEFESVIWRKTQPSPKRMRVAYAEAIKASERVRCVLHTNVLELVPNRSGGRIESLRARTLTGRSMGFRARRYVLATGAIENARILLLSDSVVRGGVGNAHDGVGRYFCEHGFMVMGRILLPGGHPRFREERFMPEVETPERRTDGVGYASTDSFRTQHRLLGFAVAAAHYEAEDRSAAGVQELARASGESGNEPAPGRSFDFGVSAEQTPNRESRVRLDPEKDALGLRKIRIEHATLALDHQSRRQSIGRLARLLSASGNARVKLEPITEGAWMPGLAGHQTGTARMSEDPKKGVTNRDGRVHGVANLFVTGGALYPTAGWQHPTFTIVALALRLADHLKATPRAASG